MADSEPWTPARIRSLGVMTELTTAAEILGIGRTLAFALVKGAEFPVPVERYGERVLRVRVADLLRHLHLEVNEE